MTRQRDRRAKRRAAQKFLLGLEDLEQRTVLSFAAPVSYPAGASAASAAVADFNGDGIADVVAANTSPGTVSVLLGNGDGTFQAPHSISTNNNPVEVEVGDIDGDGKEDIVSIGQYYTSALSVMKGNGDGTFQPPVLYPMPTPAEHVQIEDVNGDHHPDLVLSNEFFNWVGVMTNDGTGTFNTMVPYTTGTGPKGVEVGDLNGDGKPDMVAPDMSAGAVSIFLGNGDGTFQAGQTVPAGASPDSVTIADFNGDGHEDLAVANGSAAGSVTVLLGNGDGTFQTPASYPVGGTPLDIHSADFNLDGVPDLVERTSAGYSVEYGLGDGTFLAPELTSDPGGNSTSIADFNGDGSPDIVSSMSGGTVSVLINTSNNAALLDGAVTFVVSTPTTSVAGASVPVTVTAVDANGNPVTGFLGTVGISSNDPQGGRVVASYKFTAADAGTHTFASGVTLYTAGPETVTASATLMAPASQTVTVTPAAATHLSIAAPTSEVAGTPAAFTVTALDAYGNTATGYTGSVRFTSTDGQAVLPSVTTFTAADAGVKTVSATLKTVASNGQKLTAIDTAAATVTGTSSPVTVTPASAASFSLSGGGGFIGSPHAITVSARDAYGNAATGYNGTVHITSSDPLAILPADGALSGGVGSFQWTPMTVGTASITATDTSTPSITGTESGVVVTPGAATRFVVTPLSGATAGTTQAFTVTAYDIEGNVSNVYTGTVVFRSSDLRAGLPAAYTFTAADAGVHTFNVTFRTAGSQSLTVADSVNLSLTSTQTGILITPAAASSMSVTPLPAATTAGTVIPVTVTLRDPYGNIATGYQGTLNFSSVDPQASLPAAYTFTASDAGVHIFNVVFKTAEDATLTIRDPANLALAFSQGNIMVSPGAVAGFSVKAPASATKGVAFSITVSAVDAYGNIVTGYRGTVHFSDSVSGGVLPSDYTFTAADSGTHIFAITLNSTTTNIIKVVDVSNPVILGSVTENVTSGSGGSGGGGTGGGTGGGGTGGGGGGGGKGIA